MIATTTATREAGTEERDNTIEVSTAETGPRLHRPEAEARTEIEIVKATDHQAVTAEAEVGAREMNDHEDMPHHRIRRL